MKNRSPINKLADVLDSFADVEVKEVGKTPNYFIKFICTTENSFKLINTQLTAAKTHVDFILQEEELENSTSLLLEFEGSTEQKNKNIKILIKIFDNIVNSKSLTAAKNKELGLPDLSLCTVHQMAEELKRRKNLVFAMVWIEGNEKDNITLEASGNPTQIIGLLSRGHYMAIEWTDQKLKYRRRND